MTNFASELGGLQGSYRLFQILLNRILKAPFEFFDTKPIGRILDRLTNDVHKLDTTLANNFRAGTLQVFRVRFWKYILYNRYMNYVLHDIYNYNIDGLR